MRNTIVVQRNRSRLFNKPLPGWTASFGGLTGEGEDKEMAVENLERQIRHLSDGIFRHHAIRRPGGTFVLGVCPGGWCYRIIRDDSPGREGTCQMGGTWEDAVRAMERHASDWEP